MQSLGGEQNPFLRYRERLDSYAVARDAKMSDEQFVEVVTGIDSNIERVWGGLGFGYPRCLMAALWPRPAASRQLFRSRSKRTGSQGHTKLDT